MAYNKKKYIRINWKNRPSTATALGATNLNHMDVFLNDVDNALIEMDSGKLNVETANSMIASITFDKDKGLMTVRELNGTTYTYDWNVEKIPVSFSLSEDGILTMTTQDGTQFTANIADLIKDYVFDDSDTIAFTKEFQTEDNSYHVGASVKNGSIKAEHLDPDYRTDIQNFSNVAQTAANDALTYSKDSKRWAVGDASYEGSETDNSKYYKEQAENARDAAEKARDEAQAATGAVIMAPGVLGVGKPDNTTIKVTEDGTMSVPKATSDSYGLVKPDNTTIGQEDGAIRLIAKAASLLVTDTQGFVGDKNSETNVQLLIDAIADKMVKQLVSNSALTQQLANYVAKSMMSNIQVNDTDKVPTSALAYAMQQAITANANGITQLNNNLSIGRIPNKVVYMSPNGEIDCNLLTDHFVLTKGKNFPPGEGFWYVQTIGYEIKPDGTVTVGKQIAWQYTGIKLFVRDCYNDVWDSWTEYITKSDLDKVAKIDRSTSSAWVGDNDNNMIFNCNFNNKTLTVTFTDGKTVIFQGK